MIIPAVFRISVHFTQLRCIPSFESHPLLSSKKGHPVRVALFGASDVTRTRDLLITSEMHYRLCYTSKFAQLLYMEPG